VRCFDLAVGTNPPLRAGVAVAASRIVMRNTQSSIGRSSRGENFSTRRRCASLVSRASPRGRAVV
ncbi:hypothetical protein, partial [Salmonella sp. SAL4443]|uniref:hypothetical protein n=1 Tax=Salmonella sp. SAL4443 TaxID=3159898 RepID=UPI0039786DCD